MGRWSWVWLGAVGVSACTRARPVETPLAGRTEAAPSPIASHGAPAPLALDTPYEGTMVEVIEGYRRDAVEAKKPWDGLEPAKGASRQEILLAHASRGELYAKLRNKNAEVLLFIDRDTPFRVLLETLYTLGAAGCGRQLLVTGGGDPNVVQGLVATAASSQEPDVLVLMSSMGHALFLNGARVGAACGSGPRAGVAVLLTPAGQFDVAALGSCLSQLLSAEVGHSATIGANPSTSYADVIATVEVVGRHATVSFGFAR